MLQFTLSLKSRKIENKMEKFFPNYKDGSIVNLMSSILKALGYRSKYSPLKRLNPEKLKNKKHYSDDN